MFPAGEAPGQDAGGQGLMAASDPGHRGLYELPLPRQGGASKEAGSLASGVIGGEHFLVRYVAWLCRFRWFVAGVFFAYGALSLSPGLLPAAGLSPQPRWPFVGAMLLVLLNVVFLLHGRVLAGRGNARGAKSSLWAQIIIDLLVLTAVVHYLGSLETYVAFAYLFHIVLACIFFSRVRALQVVAISGILYLACVMLEEAGILGPAGIYIDRALREEISRRPVAVVMNTVSVLYIWTVVWYLASHVSKRLRRRDRELAETNLRLVEAQEAKTKHMLRTTHELKAPFAAVHANVQLLLNGLCGTLPGEANEVLGRVSARCTHLAREIQQMLQLANLRQKAEGPLEMVRLDLGETLEWAVEHIQPSAVQQGIEIEKYICPSYTEAVEDHMRMLFSNLLSNAVTYSHKGGKVRASCVASDEGGTVITIEDEGIGIPEDKLPHVFEEYYRTNEAVQHNRNSTGLGLAIVQQIAETYRIRVLVRSKVGEGTMFTLGFSPVGSRPGREKGKGVAGGLSADSRR